MTVQYPSKAIIQSVLGGYADASGDGDLRTFIGMPGYRIEVRNETVDTGQGYAPPSFVDGLLDATAALIDRRAVDELTVTNPLGQSSFSLSQTPRSAVLFQAFKNGQLLKTSDYTRVGATVNVPGVLGDWFCFAYWY